MTCVLECARSPTRRAQGRSLYPMRLRAYQEFRCACPAMGSRRCRRSQWRRAAPSPCPVLALLGQLLGVVPGAAGVGEEDRHQHANAGSHPPGRSRAGRSRTRTRPRSGSASRADHALRARPTALISRLANTNTTAAPRRAPRRSSRRCLRVVGDRPEGVHRDDHADGGEQAGARQRHREQGERRVPGA